MLITDDLYLGGFPGGGLTSATQDAGGTASPIWNFGVGPAGRILFYNIAPLTIQTNNVVTSQHLTASTAMTLTAGTGATLVAAPDGSGALVVKFDVPRSVSLTSTANLSAINVTIVGYDYLGRKQTQTRTGPNNSTVNTLKAFLSVLSVTPDTTDGTNNITVGSSDIFGLPWLISDAVYVTSVKWNNTLAADAGTLVTADATSPATAATGDPRGTYKPSSGASDGSKRLVLAGHLNGGQVGPFSTLAAVLGVTPV